MKRDPSRYAQLLLISFLYGWPPAVKGPGRIRVVVLLLWSPSCIHLRLTAVSAGSSLWIHPSKCLGLEPKWHWPLWNSKSTLPTQSCLHSTSGVPWVRGSGHS